MYFLVDVKENKANFVRELLNNFKFTKITELSKPKAQFLSELKLSIDNLNEIKKNDENCKSFDELLNEL